MKKSIKGAALLTAALAFLSSHAGNPPGLVQDIYSSSGASWSGAGIQVDATAGGMLSLPESQGTADVLFQGLMGVIESDIASAGVKVVYGDAADCSLVWDAPSRTLRADVPSGEKMTVYVADAAGRLVTNHSAPQAAALTAVELGSAAPGVYIAGIVIGNRLVKTLKFKID